VESKAVVSSVFDGYHDKPLRINRVVSVVPVVATFLIVFVLRRIFISLYSSYHGSHSVELAVRRARADFWLKQQNLRIESLRTSSNKPMPAAKEKSGRTYQIKLNLRGIEPPI
jgi:hypothetical protein